MQKYIYYLADSPNYPNEIFASSKAEVKKLILESVPDESHILKIIEANPTGNPSAEEEIDPNDFKDSQDYFKAVMNMANQEAAKHPQTPPPQAKPQPVAPSPQPQEQAQVVTSMIGGKGVEYNPNPTPVGVIKQPPKIFEEAGMFFKLEDGKLFKKQWVDVSSGDMPQFRIKSVSTGKIVPNDKYVVEKLEWVEINPD